MASPGGAESKAEYLYAEDGLDSRGIRLPDIPMIWLELEANRGVKMVGPCLLDTGFDAGLYANEDLALLLDGLTPSRKDMLQTVGGESISCEVFHVKAFLTPIGMSKRLHSLGDVEVFVPLLPDQLSFEVIVGRTLINEMILTLDGKKTIVQ